MPTRVLRTFGSYDVLGKSLPGVFFFFTMALLLPKDLDVTLSAESSFANFASIVVTLFLLGILFGEALHTLAVFLEGFLYRLGLAVLYFTNFLRSTLIWCLIRYILWALLLIPRKIALIQRARSWSDAFDSLVAVFVEGRDKWLHRRYQRTHDAFKGHRRIFENELNSYFNPDDEDNSQEDNFHFERLRDIFLSEYTMDIGKIDRLDLLYVQIASTVAMDTDGLSARFQALYSFCRGMWMVLFISPIIYYIALFLPLYQDIFPTREPQITEYISQQAILFFMLFSLLVSILFLSALASYKRHYIRYLVSEFNSAHSKIEREEYYQSEL